MALGIGNRIKARRQELNLSQTELAARLGLKSKSTICKVERGEDNLTTTAIRRYAAALECSPSYLMGWDDKEAEQFTADVLVDAFKNDVNAQKRYELYLAAAPEIQAAVDLLLKSGQSDA